MPNVSNVNFGPTEPVAGSAFVPTSDDDTICVAASTSVDVIVDITGSFTAGAGLRFVPAEPSRMIDTRSGVGGWAPIHGRDQTIDSRVAPADAEAVTGTLTIVSPVTGAFLTAYGCGTPPATSSVNADAPARARQRPDGRCQRRGPVVSHGVGRDPLVVRHHWLVGDVTCDLARGRVTGARRLVAIAAAIAVGSVTLGATESPVTAEPDIPESAPVDKRVYMVADSVGLGARGALPDAFPSDWQVVLDGTPALFVEQLESKYVRAVPQSLLGDYGVIAGGYNYPYWDPARFDRSIDSIIRAFEERGVKHVFWVTLREVKPQYITAGAWNQVQPYYWYFPTVNDHLERALDRHPNLTLIDWAAAADRSGITYDAIHLNTTGAALYSSLVRQAVDAATHRVAAGSVTRIAVPNAAGAAAVALNLTTTSPRTTGFLTAFPCDSPTPGREQPQPRPRSGRRLGGDRAGEQFGRGVRVLVSPTPT